MTSTSCNLAPVLYNPHVSDFFAATPHLALLGRRPLRKYGAILDGLRARGTPIPMLVDGTVSCFFPNHLFARFPEGLRKKIAAKEFQTWLRLNGIAPHEVELLHPQEDCSRRVLVCFSYKTATEGFALRENTFSRFHRVVMHLSHYFVSTAQKAAHLRRLPNLILAGDSDVRRNTYFQTYFSWYTNPFLVLPFSVSPRFKFGQPVSERSPKCLATGTFHYLEHEEPRAIYSDFLNTTGHNSIHPLRRAIFENKHILSDTIQSLVSPYRNYSQRSRLLNVLTRFQVSQTKYFAVDIAEAYGTYRFAVVGEEIAGFPALGALEAMACGAVLIAQPAYYLGLGLEPEIHFLPYDGTLEGLVHTVSHPPALQTLEGMAKNASSLMASHFSPEAVFSRWMSQLDQI